ncbi:hypothetical protein [Proteus mirabilis]|uniref:Uncharacterized protein n=1 Tax=Escherichia phage E21 TaxID=2663325 RepID=A0A5Q2F4W5_9CAUD|nr:hypothetical protein JT325_gp26 [Escherichia phage E21]QGF21919.1 hypothetical protein [Escherichia phage E21]UGO51530.1 hypothetical protein DANISAUR_56 [Proteus phage vB_PmiS_DanisaurMW]UNI72692.1 hypothetical protein IsfPm1_gp21 [Proteus phage Isf-Pm1]UXY92190.1 hypothetical protein [Proteus phage RP6]
MERNDNLEHTTPADPDTQIVKLLEGNPDLLKHFYKLSALAGNVGEMERSFEERVDAVFKVGIRLVMVASNRKNLIVTDDDVAKAENSTLEVSENNGNVKYMIK